MQKLIITGSTGYIGKALTHLANERGFETIALGRAASKSRSTCSRYLTVDEDEPLAIPESLGKDAVVIHLAGRAHVLKEHDADPEAAFRRTNVDLTLRIAEAAIKAGAKRFVFISSIGVNGTTSRKPLDELSPPRPSTSYAKSKWDAEEALRERLQGVMELTVIRPPLVYAHDAPGNFGKLLRLVQTGLPLPLGNSGNSRSLIALENLVDFILGCADHPNAKNETFLISDESPISTSRIAELLREGMQTSNLIFPVPKPAVRLVARLLGKSSLYEQLYDSLEISPRKASDLLGWKQKVDTSDALKAAAKYFATANQRKG